MTTQLDLPGCEHDPGRLLLQRRANAPLKPAVPQKPADVGLFGDDRNQLELNGG